MKVGGQILWNVTPICETSQIYFQMGRRAMKDVLGNHLFKGFIIPFGSLVEYHPKTAKDQSRIHHFGKSFTSIVPRIRSLRGGIWKGDVLIADLEELETMDASEIYSKRLNAKEVILPKRRRIYFYNHRWTNQNRTSTLVRPRPIQGDSHIDFLGESEGTLPQPQDSFPDAGEAINDFWSLSGSFIYCKEYIS